MSEISEAALVNLLLADYAATDAVGKLNVIGAGIAFVGEQPGGASAPFYVVVSISVPAKFAGTDFVLSIDLWNATTGGPVNVPSDDQGGLQPLRAQQVVTLPIVQAHPGFKTPPDCRATTTVAMGFPNGLPLPAGNTYDFRVQIDGQLMQNSIRFHRLAPDPGPIFGGPSGPATIPGVGPFGQQ